VYEGQFGQFTAWAAEKHPEAPALRDIAHHIAEEYAGHLNGTGISPNTFNKHIRVLDLVFRVLKRKARLTDNPWETIQRKKLQTSSRRELTVEELKLVCQKATGEFRTLFALGVYSGLRLKDCATLRWGEVDLARGIIRRVPSKTARRNPRPVIVPIHPVLRSVLENAPRHKGKEFVLPDTAQPYTAGGAGKKRIIDRIQDHFVSQKVQIYKPNTGPGTGKRAVVEVGFHSLRHTFVSLCRESNAPLAVVEAIVGHSNPAMTRHYTHVGELAAGRAVAALPSVLGDKMPAQTGAALDSRGILAKVRTALAKMNGKNWKPSREEISAMLCSLEAELSKVTQPQNGDPLLLAN
jgi:integrase